jgi:hypothetical protein
MGSETEEERLIDYEALPPITLQYRLKIQIECLLWRLRFPGKTFAFRGERIRYWAAVYNETWKNERAVELPLAIGELHAAAGKRVLEVGRVLDHYVRTRHDTVDRYEPGPRVLNVDIGSFRPAEPYDVILSISTLEHVGWDERPRDPAKAILAIRHLCSLLSPGGRLFMTVPIGHHPVLDEYLKASPPELDAMFYLKRTTAENDWVEVDRDTAHACAYGRPFPYANAIVVATAHGR